MRYPFKYIDLIDFFLEKRDVTLGGIDGYDKNFTFSKEELKTKNLNEKETIDMLKVLKTEIVWPKNENGTEHEKTVIENYEEKRNEIKIIDCTTDKLQQFKKKIRNKITKSIIKIDEKNRIIKYGNKSIKFNKTVTWHAFYCLYKNFSDVVKYEAIGWDLDGFKAHPPVEGYASPEWKKTVQNMIIGLNKRMSKEGFPKDAIKNEKKEGYRLTI